MKYDIFIKNIRKLMKQNGLSLIKFSERIGYTQPSVSKWLRGKIKPSVDAVMAICNEFDVSADWLLFGEEKMNNEMYEIIKDRLKELHMTQGELAEKVGVTQQTISYWLNGHVTPTLDKFVIMLAILKLKIELKEMTE